MKNKKKIMVVLAIILTLALLAFTGCTIDRKYNLDDLELLLISDKVDEVMQSCVVVKTTADVTLTSGQKGTNMYYGVGIAITENKILVPAQSVPKTLYNTHFYGRIIGSDETFGLYCNYADNSFVDNANLGFNILTLPINSKVKLKPIKFGKSDSLNVGQTLFGVNITIPEDELLSKSSKDFAYGLSTEDYLSVNSLMLSYKGFTIGIFDGLSKLPKAMQEASYTLQGYFNPSDTNTYTYFKEVDSIGNEIKVGYDHGMKGYITSRCFNFTNNLVFNVQGEFVGLNYARLVDNQDKNEEVVLGYGYALMSNFIKDFLKSKNIEVAA